MARFFVEPHSFREDRVVIAGEDVRHITRVLRLTKGDHITVTTGQNTDYRVEITATSKAEVIGRVVEVSSVNRDPELKVTLVQGLPKGDKMDLIIQKSTELGVTEIVPVETKRAIVKLESSRARQRVERWQRIALEAAKQCRRGRVPEVAMTTSWQLALEAVPPGALAIVPWEGEDEKSLKQVLQGTTASNLDVQSVAAYNPALPERSDSQRPQEVWVFIGPEGGLDPEEIEAARARGIIPVTLGPRILRTETAGLAVLTMILYQWGDLGGTG